MNRNLYLILMLAFVVPFTSCNDEETIESKTVVS